MPYFRQLLVYGHLNAPVSEMDLIALMYLISLVIGLVMTVFCWTAERRGYTEMRHGAAMFGATTLVGIAGLLYGAAL